MEQAFIDIYVKSRSLTPYQRQALETFLKNQLLEKKEALTKMTLTSIDCFWPEYRTPSTFYLQEDSLFGIAKQHGSLLFAILRSFERNSIAENWPTPITVRDVVGGFYSYEISVHTNLDGNILELLPYLVFSLFSCATHYDVEARALWLDRTAKAMIRLQPKLKDVEVYHKMITIIDIVSKCIMNFNQYLKEIPWDIRQVSTNAPL